MSVDLVQGLRLHLHLHRNHVNTVPIRTRFIRQTAPILRIQNATPFLSTRNLVVAIGEPVQASAALNRRAVRRRVRRVTFELAINGKSFRTVIICLAYRCLLA